MTSMPSIEKTQMENKDVVNGLLSMKSQLFLKLPFDYIWRLLDFLYLDSRPFFNDENYYRYKFGSSRYLKHHYPFNVCQFFYLPCSTRFH